jgi:hypothetical protein
MNISCLKACHKRFDLREIRIADAQWRSQAFEVGGATWRARSVSLYGGLGLSPQRSLGAEPLVRGAVANEPPEADDILYLTSMISTKINCMESTIKLHLAATAELRIAFLELCKCETALLLYTCTNISDSYRHHLIGASEGFDP